MFSSKRSHWVYKSDLRAGPTPSSRWPPEKKLNGMFRGIFFSECSVWVFFFLTLMFVVAVVRLFLMGFLCLCFPVYFVLFWLVLTSPSLGKNEKCSWVLECINSLLSVFDCVGDMSRSFKLLPLDLPTLFTPHYFCRSLFS